MEAALMRRLAEALMEAARAIEREETYERSVS